MNILNRKKSTSEERIELRVPEHLADLYPAALEHVRQHVTAITDRNWFENLSAGWLRLSVVDSLAAEKHNGLVPGIVPRPGVMMVARPAQLSRGVESTMFSEMVPESPGNMSAEREKLWEDFRYSERHAEEFAAEVTAIVDEVLASPARAWEAYQHLTAIAHATERKTRADEAEKAESRRLKIAQCPICGDSDTVRIGRIKDRQLLDGSDRGFATDVETLRSCHLCWEYAHEAYLMRNAATSTGDNRAALVAAALTRKEA